MIEISNKIFKKINKCIEMKNVWCMLNTWCMIIGHAHVLQITNVRNMVKETWMNLISDIIQKVHLAYSNTQTVRLPCILFPHLYEHSSCNPSIAAFHCNFHPYPRTILYVNACVGSQETQCAFPFLIIR